MSPNPPPQDSAFNVFPQSSVTQTDSDARVVADLLQVEGRMAWIALEQLVIRSCQPLHLGRELFE